MAAVKTPVTLTVSSVQLHRPFNGGPDEVTVVCTSASGATLDFFVAVPRNEGEKYIKSLGVKTYKYYEVKANTAGRGKPITTDETRDVV